MPRVVRPATKVVVFQWPCGMPTRRRSPRRQRPWVRAMLVDAQVSSMNTRRSGSRSRWPSNHAWRRFKTSGRSCSLARAVFFARDRMTGEEAADRAVANNNALRAERVAQLLDRELRLRLQDGEDRISVSLNPLGPAVAAHRSSPRLALLALKRPPPAHAGCAHPEP